ncbi:ABC transporter permease [Nocardioides sp.]|uniref:ABC transporter permease n=1 Tax=Nocardioides sp. TaxID=35761 RepID=UPI002D7F85FE|nr:ABC transporter permease [Nocardioides sp.]HET8962193.1 ABC transporter permease [Nocardioides sp.]
MSAYAGPEAEGRTSDGPPLSDQPPTAAKEIAGKSPMRIAFGRLVRDKIAVACAFVTLAFILVAMFAGTICNIFNVSTETVLASQYLDVLGGGLPKPEYGPPNGGFTIEHPFGIAPRTANDNLAWWVYGCRTSLSIAGLATVIAAVTGVVVGLTAGFLGGIVDRILSFITDVFLTVPFLLAALTIAPIVNERFRESENYGEVQFWTLIAVLAVFGWMPIARLIRGEVLSLREREFIQSARVLGMPTGRILLRELLPNLAAPIVVAVSLMLPAFVTLEAGLAFLGIGVTEKPSWGQTITLAVDFFETYPLYLYEPLLGVVLLVLALNLLGDAVRDALDPKTRR